MREVSDPTLPSPEPLVDPVTGEPIPEPTEPVEGDDDNDSDEEGERYDGGDIPPAS